MLVGLDFDNTIVCYDKAIARLADELLSLPSDLPKTKVALRDFLRRTKRESEWTLFQGTLYGPGMAYAEPFKLVFETIKILKDMGHSFCVVSHRSLRPYAGPSYDLHASARDWIEERLVKSGFIESTLIHFHETRDQKIASVDSLGCEVFLDDLPEVLGDEHFPKTCQAILFDPNGVHDQSKHLRIERWDQIPALLRNFA